MRRGRRYRPIYKTNGVIRDVANRCEHRGESLALNRGIPVSRSSRSDSFVERRYNLYVC